MENKDLDLSTLKSINPKDLSEENLYFLQKMPEEHSRSCLKQLEATNFSNNGQKIQNIPKTLQNIIKKRLKVYKIDILPFHSVNISETIEKEKEIEPVTEIRSRRKRQLTPPLYDVFHDPFMLKYPSMSSPNSLKKLSYQMCITTTIEETQNIKKDDTEIISSDEEDIIVNTPKENSNDFPPINENIPDEIKSRILTLQEKIIKQKRDFEKILKKI